MRSQVSTELLFRFDFAAMGSPCVLALYVSDRQTAEKIAETAIEEVRRIEWRYSRYRSDGVLSQINRAATIGSGLSVDNETARLIDWAFLARSQSDGLFDVTTGLLRRLWNEESAAVPTDQEIANAISRIGLDKVSWNCPWLIPTRVDQNPWAQSRRPMDMIRQGWSTSLFQASQQ